MWFGKYITIAEEVELPLWNKSGDERKIKVAPGLYEIRGTDGHFASRIVVHGVSLRFEHL